MPTGSLTALLTSERERERLERDDNLEELIKQVEELQKRMQNEMKKLLFFARRNSIDTELHDTVNHDCCDTIGSILWISKSKQTGPMIFCLKFSNNKCHHLEALNK